MKKFQSISEISVCGPLSRTSKILGGGETITVSTEDCTIYDDEETRKTTRVVCKCN